MPAMDGKAFLCLKTYENLHKKYKKQLANLQKISYNCFATR